MGSWPGACGREGLHAETGVGDITGRALLGLEGHVPRGQSLCSSEASGAGDRSQLNSPDEEAGCRVACASDGSARLAEREWW